MKRTREEWIASACEVGQRHPTVKLGKRPFLSWRLTSENHERRTGNHERAMFSGQEIVEWAKSNSAQRGAPDD